MKVGKSFLNYCFWGLSSLFLIASIGVSTFGFSENKKIIDNIFPIIYRYGICILFAIVVLGLVFGFDKLKKNEKIKEKLFPDNTSGVSITGGIEIGAMFFLTVIAIVVRAVAMISVDGKISGDSIFFDCVVNKTPLGDAVLSNGAHIYVSVLSFFLDFLGHKAGSAMVVSLFFTCASMVIMFFVIRKMLGSAPAWFAFLLMAYMPGSFMSVTYVSPDTFYLFVLSLYLLALSTVLNLSKGGKIKFGSHMFYFILLGIFAGFIAYMDIIGFVLPFVSVLAFSAYESDDLWNNKQKGWCQSIYFIIAFVLSLALLAYQFSWVAFNGKIDGLINFGRSFIPTGVNLEAVCPHFGMKDGIGLYCVALIWVIVFIKDEFDRALPFMAVIAVSSITMLLGMDFSSHTVILSAMWCIVGGIGIYSMPKMINMGMTEEQIDERKMKRIEKENRKAYENGERSIKLAPAAKPSKKKNITFEQTENSAQSAPVKKGYGIGKKSQPAAETGVPAAPVTTVTPVAPVMSAPPEQPATPADENKREDRPIIGLGVNSGPIIKSETISPSPVNTISNQSPLTAGNSIVYDNSNVNSSIKNSLGGEGSMFSGVSSDAYNVNFGPSTPTFSYDVTSNDDSQKLNLIDRREVTITPENSNNSAPTMGIIKSDTPVIAAPLTAQPETPVITQIGVNSSFRTDSLANKTSESMVIKSDTPVTVIPQSTPDIEKKEERPITHIGFGTFSSNTPVQTPSGSIVKSDTPVIGNFVSNQESVPSQPKTETPPPMVIVPMPGSENSMFNKDAETKEESLYKRPTTLIRNPLPTPKPHVPKEMDYDHRVNADEMHYDFDTYGKDFYDI